MMPEETLKSPSDNKEIKPVSPKGNIHWKDWCWSWSSSTLATWCEEPTYWQRPWFWERLRARGEGGSRGWDGWMASLIQWVSLTNLREMVKDRETWHTAVHGSQRVGHDLASEQQPPADLMALRKVKVFDFKIDTSFKELVFGTIKRSRSKSVLFFFF